MKGITEINELIKQLVEIDNAEGKLNELIQKIRAELLRRLLNPTPMEK
jgi:hypothetical protein